MRVPTSLRTHLVLLTLVATLPALFLATCVGVAASSTEQARARAEVYRLALQASIEQEQLVQNTRALLAVVSQLPTVRQIDPAGCSRMLGSLVPGHPEYTNLFVLDRNGNSVCSGVPLGDQTDGGDRAWFYRTLRAMQFTVGTYSIGVASGRPILTVATPLFDAQNQVQGIVGAGLDLGWLNHVLQTAKLPGGANVTVYDREATVLARQPATGDWVGKRAPPEAFDASIPQRQNGTGQGRGLDGVDRVYGFTPLGPADAGVYVAVGMPTSHAFALAHAELLRSLAGVAAVALLALLAAWVGGHWLLVRPLRRLVRSTTQIAGGDLQARAATAGVVVEVQRLASAFNTMAVALRDRELANEQLRATLQEQALRDPLTGLFNRRYLEEALERELRRAERRRSAVSVVMLDLDHFKRFNDTFGHKAGDVLLCEVARYLQDHVRKEDVVCRYGGEELTLILPDAALQDALGRAEQLRQGIKQIAIEHQGRLLGTVTASMGVATLGARGGVADDLLGAADAALYRAKLGGRDQVQCAATIAEDPPATPPVAA